MPRQTAANHRSGKNIQRSEQGSGAVALIVMGHRAGSTLLHRQRWLGVIQGLDLRLLVHAQHRRLARRVQVQTTTSISFSSKCRSLDGLKVFTRCGLSPRADQIRCTDAELTSACFAIDRHDQCVSPSGFVCSVKSTISATFSSLIDGLRPRPLATSPNPTSPSFSNWPRQASTVGRDTPTTSPIPEFDTPSPAKSNTRARCTTRCAALCDPKGTRRVRNVAVLEPAWHRGARSTGRHACIRGESRLSLRLSRCARSTNSTSRSGNSQYARHVAAEMVMEGVGSGLCGRREADGYTLGHVARVERRLGVVGGKGVDHLIVVDYRYGGSWADCELRRVEGKILDSHCDSRDQRRCSSRRGRCAAASTGAQKQ
jgi:hypothetical protein